MTGKGIANSGMDVSPARAHHSAKDESIFKACRSVNQRARDAAVFSPRFNRLAGRAIRL
jgi:hypothetical protein